MPVLLPNESWDQGPSRYRGLDDCGIKHLLKVGLFAHKESGFPLHPPRGRRDITSINFMLQNGEISDIKLAAGIYVLELRLQTSELGSLKQVLQMGKQLRPTFCKIPDLPPWVGNNLCKSASKVQTIFIQEYDNQKNSTLKCPFLHVRLQYTAKNKKAMGILNWMSKQHESTVHPLMIRFENSVRCSSTSEWRRDVTTSQYKSP